jgi:hypothetical protein
MFALDWLTSDGRKSVMWRRLQEEPSIAGAKPVISHALSMEWLLLRARIDLRPELTGVYTVSRTTPGSAVNLRFALSGVAHW